MSRFNRPAGSIDHYGKLRKWDVLWHVYGIMTPFMCGPEIVVRPAFREADGSFVFQTRRPRLDFVSTNFASDGNLLPDHSHNDNYWFFTEREAVAAKIYLEAQWACNSKMREEERQRRASEHRMHMEYDYAH